MDYQHARFPAAPDIGAVSGAIAAINAHFSPEVELVPSFGNAGVWDVRCRWLPAAPSLWLAVSDEGLEWPTATDPLAVWLLDTLSTSLAVALGATETWHDCTGEAETWPLDFTRRWPTFTPWEKAHRPAAPGLLGAACALARACDRDTRAAAAFFDGLPPPDPMFVLPDPPPAALTRTP
jgi:hypothetical protein